MIPIMLDPRLVRIALCGEGDLTVRRLKWLQDCGANPIVYAPSPSPALSQLVGDNYHAYLPSAADLAGIAAIWIADLSNDVAGPIWEICRQLNILVNVEDVLDYCDFHTPAIVHRGRLTFAIGTGGASPAIASLIRQKLETAFPAQWSGLVDEIAASRLALKAKGATFGDLVTDAKARVLAAGL